MNRKKQFKILIFSAVILVIGFTACVQTQKQKGTLVWDGNVARSFDSGTGSKDDPYIIATTQQLAFLAAKVNENEGYRDVFFRLENDLDLGGTVPGALEWIPVGINTRAFEGTFDGNRKTITGLVMSAKEKTGLFGKIGEKGTVANLRFDAGCYIRGETSGMVTAINRGTISCCVSTADVGGHNCGGIAGISSGPITKCIVRGNVRGERAGGIAGTSSGLIDCCAFKGVVSSSNDFSCHGGIAGYMPNGGEITNCYNRGKIEPNRYGIYRNGGILGASQSHSPNYNQVRNCYDAGESATALLGDLIGDAQIISNCYYDLTLMPKNEIYNEFQLLDRKYFAGRPTAKLKSPEMSNALNKGNNDGPWEQDHRNANNGYPVLKMEQQVLSLN